MTSNEKAKDYVKKFFFHYQGQVLFFNGTYMSTSMVVRFATVDRSLFSELAKSTGKNDSVFNNFHSNDYPFTGHQQKFPPAKAVDCSNNSDAFDSFSYQSMRQIGRNWHTEGKRRTKGRPT
jgi:hypothetical protein